MPSKLPTWESLREAAPEHVNPPPRFVAKDSTKHGAAHRIYRVECTCEHTTVWAATERDALSKWMNHLALVSGLKKPTNHRKVTPGSHPRSS
ncbi:hypothetical protein [Glaciibacter psychrotolerans]|uniref:RAB protein geranylgeranyltransferase component A n=1 Tax=Glaciibacter psychrotolerans TaxID=670054 RepID=A0A7Z0J4V9_9MICO|nr:hypothetical protein [Leifsonia psychrotolerans]NYJ18486.1 RAB protein geranylgeranyltransferase component A [Leifsonia psychrotolerans]